MIFSYLSFEIIYKLIVIIEMFNVSDALLFVRKEFILIYAEEH